MSQKTLRIAMGQMLVEGGQPEANMCRAVDLIHKSGEMSSHVIVLPECLDIGWTHPSARKLAQSIPGPYSDRLADAAIDAGVYVAAGLVERAREVLYNTAVLISPEGQILRKHRKINELNIAHDLYSTGTSLEVINTPIGKIGLNICADNFSSSLVLGHALARMGAEIILSPSAWAVPAEHDNQADPYGPFWIGPYSELARLYDIPVIGVSNVGQMDAGPWAGQKCIGCSLAVDAGGEVVHQSPYGDNAEDLAIVEVHIHERRIMGTDYGEMLAGKGYTGP